MKEEREASTVAMSFQSAFPVCNTVLNLYDYIQQKQKVKLQNKIENPHIRRIELLSLIKNNTCNYETSCLVSLVIRVLFQVQFYSSHASLDYDAYVRTSTWSYKR